MVDKTLHRKLKIEQHEPHEKRGSFILLQVCVCIVALYLNFSVLATLFRVITVFTIFRLLTDFVCLYTYEF